MVRFGVLLLVVGCGDPGGVETASTGPSTGPSNSPSSGASGEPVDLEEPMSERENLDPPHGTLSARIELVRDTLRAGGDASNDEEARLEARLYVRNTGSEPREISFVIPASYELEWRLTAGNGTVYLPTFLPPGMPGPGGPPRSAVNLEAGAESPMAIAVLHGISGFFKQGDEVETWGPLPRGRYEVVVSEIRLDDGPPLATAPVTLTVQ